MCVALYLELKHYKHRQYRKHRPLDTCGLLYFTFFPTVGEEGGKIVTQTEPQTAPYSLSKASGHF